mmetsp:Transcript_30977/g.73902  ORF Transcript_30977/g.73902 Transcript_30977/m.73902 type:complete len:237 (-) Transcript_30977:601-1311(-)
MCVDTVLKTKYINAGKEYILVKYSTKIHCDVTCTDNMTRVLLRNTGSGGTKSAWGAKTALGLASASTTRCRPSPSLARRSHPAGSSTRPHNFSVGLPSSVFTTSAQSPLNTEKLRGSDTLPRCASCTTMQLPASRGSPSTCTPLSRYRCACCVKQQLQGKDQSSAMKTEALPSASPLPSCPSPSRVLSIAQPASRARATSTDEPHARMTSIARRRQDGDERCRSKEEYQFPARELR